MQQGDVSSTEHLIEPINGQYNAELLAQYGALKHYTSTFGLAIIQINSDGIIESVTDNIKDLIQFTSAELLKQQIYSYLHPSDQAKLSPLLNNNMSFPVANWDRQDDGPTVNGERSIQKRIRMLIKCPDNVNDLMEQKPQKYEELVMLATTQFNKGMQTYWYYSTPKWCGRWFKFLTKIPISPNSRQRWWSRWCINSMPNQPTWRRTNARYEYAAIATRRDNIQIR